MKIKHIIPVISPLVCVLGWNCLALDPVNAAILDFSYTLGSNETISGSFEGDFGSDNNRLSDLRNFTAVYSGEPSVTFDTLEVGNFFEVDKSDFQLSGTSSSAPGALFLAERANNGGGDISVFFPPNDLDDDTTIVVDRLTVQVDTSQQSVETTPEPGITLALALLGSFGCWQKLKKKQVSSS